MSHLHEYVKHIGGDDEQLTDSTGALVTYIKPPKADFTMKERFGSALATVQYGASYTAPDATGTIVDQTATSKYGEKMVEEGGSAIDYCEVVTKCRVNLGAGVTSF
jgi:hypothetical protein